MFVKERVTDRLLKAFSWKSPTALQKRPAPMRRMKFVMMIRKAVRAAKKREKKKKTNR